MKLSTKKTSFGLEAAVAKSDGEGLVVEVGAEGGVCVP